jgi:hypothetical protein
MNTVRFQRSFKHLRNERGGATAIVIAILAVAAIGFAVWYFAFRGGGGGSSPSAKLAQKVIPADCEVMGGVNIAALLNDLDYGKFGEGMSKSKVEEMLKQQGLAIDDLQALSFGIKMDGLVPKGAVFALQSKADANTITGILKMAAMGLPGEVRDLIDPNTIESLEGGIFVMGSTDLVGRAKALGQGGAQAAGKAEADLLAKALDLGATAWVVAPMPLDELPGGMMTEIAMKGVGLGKPSHIGVSVRIGSSFEVTTAAHIPGGDANKLIDGVKTLKDKFSGALPAEAKKLLDTVDFGGSGPVLTARMKLPMDELIGLAKNLD